MSEKLVKHWINFFSIFYLESKGSEWVIISYREVNFDIANLYGQSTHL